MAWFNSGFNSSKNVLAQWIAGMKRKRNWNQSSHFLLFNYLPPSLFLAPLIDRSFNSYELFAHSLKSFLLIIQLLVYSTAISFLSLLSDIDFSSSLTEIKWRNARRRKLNLNSEWIMTEFQFNSFKPEKIEPLLNNEAAIN